MKKTEALHSNKEKYFFKTIGYKLKYIIHDSTNTAVANLILLDNIGLRVKCHFKLPLLLVLWPYRKKIAHAMYYSCRC